MSREADVLAAIHEDGYTSGQAISKQLNISRSAVWKYVVKLREQGYVIEASPRKGYRLTRRPDRLLPAEIAPGLQTQVVGSRIVHEDRVDSTADLARRLIDESAPEGTVVIAEMQTHGRGRMGRVWQTPAHEAIALSVILYPDLPPTRTPLLSLAAALAVKKAVEPVIRAVTGAETAVRLKWPNDIYLGDRKLAGVLVEMATDMDRVKWVVVSIGLNVNNRFADADLAARATSLKAEFGRAFSRRDLLTAILTELDEVYELSRDVLGLETLRQEFGLYDVLQGKQVTVATPGGSVSGRVTGIDPEGRLLVEHPDGVVEALFSGEATLSGGQGAL
ncbi:MAG: biotin--[acetyl-CoA-carboxylase] ligase [Thermoleophilia bacterium]